MSWSSVSLPLVHVATNTAELGHSPWYTWRWGVLIIELNPQQSWGVLSPWHAPFTGRPIHPLTYLWTIHDPFTLWWICQKGLNQFMSISGVAEQVRQTWWPLDQRLLYHAWIACRCDLRGPKFQNFMQPLRRPNMPPLYFVWPDLKCFHHPWYTHHKFCVNSVW